MNRGEAISAIVEAMPHWANAVNYCLAQSSGASLRELAREAIRTVDHWLAYGSETVGYGYALDDLRRARDDGEVLGVLEWWDKAYQAWYLTSPADDHGYGGALDEDDELCPQAIRDRIDELILTGEAEQALELAERWSAGEAE